MSARPFRRVLVPRCSSYTVPVLACPPFWPPSFKCTSIRNSCQGLWSQRQQRWPPLMASCLVWGRRARDSDRQGACSCRVGEPALRPWRSSILSHRQSAGFPLLGSRIDAPVFCAVTRKAFCRIFRGPVLLEGPQNFTLRVDVVRNRRWSFTVFPRSFPPLAY